MNYNILHIVATGKLSGAEKVVLDICTNLDREKFKTSSVVAGKELQQLYINNNINTWIIDISRLNFLQILKLRKLIKKENINIIHAHDVKASISSVLAVSFLGVPVISHLHSNYLWMKENIIMKNIDKHFRKKYALNIACSTEVENFYKENNADFDFNKMVTLGNAFNLRELYDTTLTEREEFMKNNSIPLDKYVFGYVGRLISLKGVDFLLKGFANYLKENGEAVLVIVGDGIERNNLSTLTKQLGIADKVHFMGFRQDVYNFLNIFDAFIIPSEIEGLPMVILEAMAMGKPIISTQVGGIPEVIINGKTGILLKNRSVECLTNAMRDVSKDLDMSKLLGQNAKEYITTYRNLSTYIERLEEIYFKMF